MSLEILTETELISLRWYHLTAESGLRTMKQAEMKAAIDQKAVSEARVRAQTQQRARALWQLHHCCPVLVFATAPWVLSEHLTPSQDVPHADCVTGRPGQAHLAGGLLDGPAAGVERELRTLLLYPQVARCQACQCCQLELRCRGQQCSALCHAPLHH